MSKVVAALLHEHRWQVQLAEQPARLTKTVGGDLQRTVRIVGLGINAQRNHQRCAFMRAHCGDERGEPGKPLFVTSTGRHRNVERCADTGTLTNLVGVAHEMRIPPSTGINMDAAI